uniref:Uncharacterized protein n=1 Tax=Bicosoecida sp. CB-2014 TaxID=1486930 RepID=A0A7S1CJW1_9STRA|mmetsp:Transcript_3601/g.13139  ORF Transcript_3601/g.13139 Transcript_3601/m.13139 type:complete len:219 (+) Transcript_3601:159-815(+)
MALESSDDSMGDSRSPTVLAAIATDVCRSVVHDDIMGTVRPQPRTVARLLQELPTDKETRALSVGCGRAETEAALALASRGKWHWTLVDTQEAGEWNEDNADNWGRTPHTYTTAPPRHQADWKLQCRALGEGHQVLVFLWGVVAPWWEYAAGFKGSHIVIAGDDTCKPWPLKGLDDGDEDHDTQIDSLLSRWTLSASFDGANPEHPGEKYFIYVPRRK